MKKRFSEFGLCICVLCISLAVCACSRARKNTEATDVRQNREAPDAATADTRPTIVALGNSLTAGQGVDPARNYPSQLQKIIDREGYAYRVLNFGVSGDTSSQALGRLDSIIRIKPAIVIVELGANDGLRGTPAEVTKQNLSIIVERLQASGSKVLLAGMEVPPNYGPQYSTSFRNLFPEIAKKYRVPLIPFFLEGVGGMPDLNQDDGIHPTGEGYRIVVERLWKTLLPLL